MRLPGPDYAAPAKLNLFLHVVGRRADGYHLLQSAFVLIDLQDTLRMRVRDDGRIVRVSELAGVPEESDLVVRAAKKLQEATGTALGADIEVEKRIPVAGGLGGGSSDAATVLLVLDRLWRTGLGPAGLAAIGVSLGADVPFFIHGRNAWVEGIGERITPLEIAPAWYVVLAPGVGVPTPVAFAAPELTRDTEALKMEDFSAHQFPGTSGVGAWHRNGLALKNDLEPVVAARFPEVARHLQWLRTQGEARMTGSGGCVFAAFDSRGAAQAVLERMPAEMTGFLARGLERHPLALSGAAP